MPSKLAHSLLLAAFLTSGCSVTNRLYEGFFPGVNFSPDKYDAIPFDLAVSPSAADRNRHQKLKFDAYYYGVANNLGKGEIVSQHVNIILCEDRSRQSCSHKIAVHDLDVEKVTKTPKGSAVTFYGMVGEVQGVQYGDISVANKGGNLDGIFFLKVHQLLPKV